MDFVSSLKIPQNFDEYILYGQIPFNMNSSLLKQKKVVVFVIMEDVVGFTHFVDKVCGGIICKIYYEKKDGVLFHFAEVKINGKNIIVTNKILGWETHSANLELYFV